MMAVFIMPCADMFGKEVFGPTNCVQEIAHQDGHNQSGHNDLCSPFCSCNCCGLISGVVLNLNLFHKIQERPIDLVRPTIYFRSVFIPRYFGEIWQPPKINT